MNCNCNILLENNYVRNASPLQQPCTLLLRHNGGKIVLTNFLITDDIITGNGELKLYFTLP